jgi:serine/threonine protein phosphatase 1
MTTRNFVIGDVHGAYRGLKQVLEKVNFDFDNDTLISLGDIADGWSETYECIELFMKIKNFTLVRGNHDEWATRFLELTLKTGPADYNWVWFSQGGRETYNSYYHKQESVSKHILFLESAKLYHIDKENRLFLHAGLDPDVDLDKQTWVDVGQGSGENAVFYWDRKFWTHLIHLYNNKESIIWPRYSEIYIGHTPTNRKVEFEDGLPVNIGNVWNMDTGAGYDGKISLMDLDTKEITQSDSIYLLYPDEMGRNGKFLAKK